MARTDIHSPTNLVTEDYEYEASGCFTDGMGGPGYSPLANESRYLIDEGWTMGENHSAGSCYHCGAHLNYYAIMKHLPSHTLVRIGEQCLANRFDRATADFQRLRKQMKLNREETSRAERRAAFDAAHQAVVFELKTEVNSGRCSEFYISLWSQLEQKGELSEAQVAAVERGIERRHQREDTKAKMDAALPDPAPVVEGRIEIRGTVVSVKTKHSDFGERLVMTVCDDRGFRVWGSVPKNLAGDQRNELGDAIVVRTGDRVSFTATVTKSDRDETFGFFKRPTSAGIISRAEAA